MREPDKSYESATAVCERLADDGWPEDAGLWPVAALAKNSNERVQGFRRVSQLVKSLLRTRDRLSTTLTE
jgi:hypothetical protein